MRAVRSGHDSEMIKHVPPASPDISFVALAACNLRRKVVAPANGVLILNLKDVVRCWQSIVACETESSNVDRRTAESRIRPVLAAKGIHFKKLGYRPGCYVIGKAYEAFLDSASLDRTAFIGALSHKKRCQLLDQVGRRFCEQKEYWDGDWSMNEEVTNIPKKFWRDCVIQISSSKRRRIWKASPIAMGMQT